MLITNGRTAFSSSVTILTTLVPPVLAVRILNVAVITVKLCSTVLFTKLTLENSARLVRFPRLLATALLIYVSIRLTITVTVELRTCLNARCPDNIIDIYTTMLINVNVAIRLPRLKFPLTRLYTLVIFHWCINWGDPSWPAG